MPDAFRINIRDMRIAFLLLDDKAGAKFEKPEIIPGAMQIQLAPRVATASLNGDGRMRHKEVLVDGYDVTFDHNKVPPQILARMRGQEYSTEGVRRANAKDTSVFFALGWAVDLTSSFEELTWLPKCVAAPSNKNIQQRVENNINYSTDTLAITAMPLEYNGDYEYTADTSDEESKFTAEQAAKWFDEVLVLPPKGTAAGPTA